MFVSNSRKIILPAYRSQKSIGAFNVHNLEIFDAVLQAANKMRVPVIVQLTPMTLQYFSPAYFRDLAQTASRIYPEVPLVLHLDHGKDLTQILECLEMGFSSVMVDASDQSLEKNIKITKSVVKAAKRFRVAVEAEVGIMPNHKKVEKIKLSSITDAKFFIKETGIDFLAMPFGTHHGMDGPEGIEHINFDWLKTVFKEIKIPLVLHGASGVARDELKRARLYGVAKVNFDTAIRKMFTNTLRKFLWANPEEEDLRIYMHAAAGSIEKLVTSKIKALYF
jgi:tagatose 1,6-diphosphate aldolase GatY/KbaY